MNNYSDYSEGARTGTLRDLVVARLREEIKDQREWAARRRVARVLCLACGVPYEKGEYVDCAVHGVDEGSHRFDEERLAVAREVRRTDADPLLVNALDLLTGDLADEVHDKRAEAGGQLLPQTRVTFVDAQCVCDTSEASLVLCPVHDEPHPPKVEPEDIRSLFDVIREAEIDNMKARRETADEDTWAIAEHILRSGVVAPTSRPSQPTGEHTGGAHEVRH